MLTLEQKKELNEIFEELTRNLDISETEYELAVKSYGAVGEWLSKKGSILSKYKPEILPQGSFLLGTVIKPINDDDDIDIDLVCQLKSKEGYWTQKDLKQNVGFRLKENETYKKMSDKEGRRCWTLKYRENSNSGKYHMDILPAITNDAYSLLLEKAFSASTYEDFEKLALRITDRESNNYDNDPNIQNWLKSNPFGYARWFYNQAIITTRKMFSLNESIKPVPKYQKNKLPLQRAIQILKRHRDIMFNGDENKPISIIITTLAAKAYNQEDNVFDALTTIIGNMRKYIEKKYDYKKGKYIYFIANPVNKEENFADKWIEHPIREKYFFKWLDKLETDFSNIKENSKGGLNLLTEVMKKTFGENLIKKTFSSYGEKKNQLRKEGLLKMSKGSGILGNVGSKIKNHNFYGAKEEE